MNRTSLASLLVVSAVLVFVSGCGCCKNWCGWGRCSSGYAPPVVAGRRATVPARWVDAELFAALVKECKRLLKVLW